MWNTGYNKYIKGVITFITLTYLVWVVVWQVRLLKLVDSSYFSSKALREISRGIDKVTSAVNASEWERKL